jgi:hypothetical protein
MSCSGGAIITPSASPFIVFVSVVNKIIRPEVKRRKKLQALSSSRYGRKIVKDAVK